MLIYKMMVETRPVQVIDAISDYLCAHVWCIGDVCNDGTTAERRELLRSVYIGI